MTHTHSTQHVRVSLLCHPSSGPPQLLSRMGSISDTGTRTSVEYVVDEGKGDGIQLVSRATLQVIMSNGHNRVNVRRSKALDSTGHIFLLTFAILDELSLSFRYTLLCIAATRVQNSEGSINKRMDHIHDVMFGRVGLLVGSRFQTWKTIPF